jgi:hypothetical protein
MWFCLTYQVTSEFVKRIKAITSSDGNPLNVLSMTKDLLTLLYPWLQPIDLISTKSKNVGSLKYLKGCWIYPPLAISRPEFLSTILRNMVYLTERFGNSHASEVESIWLSLVGLPVNSRGYDLQSRRGESYRGGSSSRLSSNIVIIIDFLLDIGVERNNQEVIQISRRIISYLLRTHDTQLKVTDYLISKLSFDDFALPLVSGVKDGSTNQLSTPTMKIPDVPGQLFTIDLDYVVPALHDTHVIFSRGGLACMFLVDLVIEVHVDVLAQYVPRLLHIIFIQLDHDMILICEENRLLLVNLIRAIIPRDIAVGVIDDVLESLDFMKGDRAWNYEDITPATREIQSTGKLNNMVLKIVELFSIVDQSIAQSWGEVALEWSTSCSVRHIACRSLQIFRYFDVV